MATTNMKGQIFSTNVVMVHLNKGMLNRVSCHHWHGQSVML